MWAHRPIFFDSSRSVSVLHGRFQKARRWRNAEPSKSRQLSPNSWQQAEPGQGSWWRPAEKGYEGGGRGLTDHQRWVRGVDQPKEERQTWHAACGEGANARNVLLQEYDECLVSHGQCAICCIRDVDLAQHVRDLLQQPVLAADGHLECREVLCRLRRASAGAGSTLQLAETDATERLHNVLRRQRLLSEALTQCPTRRDELFLAVEVAAQQPQRHHARVIRRYDGIVDPRLWQQQLPYGLLQR